MKYATDRLEMRTTEAEAMEAEELQNALNQPTDGGGAGGASGGEPGAGGARGGEVAAVDDGTSETAAIKGVLGTRGEEVTIYVM